MKKIKGLSGVAKQFDEYADEKAKTLKLLATFMKAYYDDQGVALMFYLYVSSFMFDEITNDTKDRFFNHLSIILNTSKENLYRFNTLGDLIDWTDKLLDKIQPGVTFSRKDGFR